ncbi:MAG: hypothetical protein C4527_25210 [Candidatus Omnitrophota bacterium]|jgi:DNA repair exonuclease SbcCD ATPase subunit|nr:MAG: hypothetical protein C4527_25210 [Candidatus Omnitrophota bacterium]
MQNNKPSPQEKNALRNTEHHIPTGLVVTGLVAIVGSWIGMAAFVDYRLDGVEKQIKSDTNEVVTTLDKNFSKELTSLQKDLTGKVTDTSSVLAKGILDLTTNEEQRYQQMLKAINDNGALIESNRTELASAVSREIKESEKQIASLVTQAQHETTEEVNKAIAAAVEKQEVQNQAITNALSGIDEKAAETGREILTTVKTFDQNLTNVNSNLFSQIEHSVNSLQELIQLSNQSRSEELTQMAAKVDGIVNGVQTESNQLSSELNTLANQINTMQNEISASQTAVQELNNLVPGWRKTSEEQLAAIKVTADSLDRRIEENLSALHNKIVDLGVAVDNTANSLMKSLHTATEGLEDTKIELKSNLAKSKEDTTTELQSLVKTIENVANSIESLKKTASENASVSRLFHDNQDVENIKGQIGDISSKMETLHTQISSQITEAKAHAQKMIENAQEEEYGRDMNEVVRQFSNVTDSAQNQLSSLRKGIESLSKVIMALQDNVSTTESGSTEISEAPAQINANIETSAEAEIGMRVDEKTKRGEEISLN